MKAAISLNKALCLYSSFLIQCHRMHWVTCEPRMGAGTIRIISRATFEISAGCLHISYSILHMFFRIVTAVTILNCNNFEL